MAVKVHEYFRLFQRRTVIVLGLLQLAVAFLGAWLVMQAGFGSFAFVFAIMALVNLASMPIIFHLVSRPFGKLSKAVAHVSKDPVITEPPKLSPADNRSGLKDLVQTVYELAVAMPGKPAATTKTSSAGDSFFEQVMQTMPCGVIVISGGEVSYKNAAAPVSDGPNKQPIINLNFDQNDNLGTWLADCQANKVRDSRLWLRVADKLPGEQNQRIFDVAAFYQKGGDQDIEAVIITFDRTAVYRLDQEDMDFIALAAHELRGPITVIRGYLDVFAQELGEKLDAEQHDLLERLEVSAEKLSSYVNNILNVSRYDRNQFAIHPQEEHLKDIMATIVPDLMLRAKTQHRKLEVTVAEGLPTIAADSSGIGEVITNIVDNAIKYSSENGEILVKAGIKDGQVEITVQDKGIGIPAAVTGNLFSRFYRSHRTRQGVGGTGLGLYICKAIVEMHGGRIWVRSVEGQGSTFGVILPTYASVADKLQKGDNIDITRRPEGWIKNHAMVRR